MSQPLWALFVFELFAIDDLALCLSRLVLIVILSLSSYESGVLEDPAHEGPEDLYQMTKDPKTSPEQPDKLEITFKNGIWID